MLLAGELDERRPGDVLGQVASEREGKPEIVTAVEHERRRSDRPEDGADVDVEIADGVHRLECARAERQPLEARAPGDGRWILECHRRILARRSICTAPGRIQHRRLRFGGSLAQPDRIVDRLADASEGIAEQERLGALGIRRGEQHRDRAAVAVTEEDDARAAHGVDDGGDVVHPTLDGGNRTERDRVGDAGAPLVEADHASHGRQALEEACDRRLLPHDLDVVWVIRHEDDVARAAAEHLVGNVALGAPHVLRLRLHLSLPPRGGATGALARSPATTGLRPPSAPGVRPVRTRADG